ncbi:DMT family transporter [Sphingomonas sp. AOB5]|uniref:DMT family transporter n=1 Tax=Sphingomonas sp. AOB5 TaxID=3034017 RepID=UPI0023F96747|nr:DMT family transporter [Sphingomonas sp. AOB5]MDF7775343.1 DMT family transporter [Sphingomonas sp. AOB5]
MLKSNTTRAYAMLAIVMLFWAGNSIVGRAIHGQIPPLTLAWFRWTGALLVLLPFALPHLRAEAAAIRASWKRLLLLGLLGVASFNAFLYTALEHMPATNSLLLQAAIPALVLLCDRLLYGVRATWLVLASVLLSTIGVLFVVLHGDFHALLALRLGKGEILMLIAVAVWSLYSSMLRERPAVSQLAFLAVTFAIGVAAMTPLALWEAASGRHVAWSAGAAGAILYVALFPSLIAYLLFNMAVEAVGAAKAGQASTLLPLFGALLAALFLGEALHGYHLMGMALILLGIAMSAFSRPAKSVSGP